MSKIAVHFIGFLVNVDDSVLGLKLGDGFDIIKQSQQQIMKIISRIEFHYGVNGTIKDVLGFDTDGRPSGSYCVVKYNAEELEGTDQGGVVISVAGLQGIEQSIRNKIRLLRLFKEGNVFLCFSCFYYMKDLEPAVFQIARAGPLADTTRFELVESEIANAQSFLANNKIPFGNPQIQLAFESFELSYESHNLGLAFLSLMISLETLLNPSDHELKFRVSRNTAVLLGKNCEDSKDIFAKVKDLYDKRSKLVHTGKHETITPEDVLCLRNYVREVIKEITKIGGDLKCILDTLNTCGFGEQPWRKR